jgi:CzcA family heavy metal efflux pump
MLSRVVGFCLGFPRLVALAGLAVMAVGVMAALDGRYDVFPDFGTPTVTIETASNGLAPRQIEGLVTTPVEDAVIGTPGLRTLRSVSQTGLSLVTAVFRGHTDIDRDRQLIAERLGALAGRLPAGAQPVLAPLQSSTGVALTVGLRSDRLSLMQLTGIARWTIRPALLAVPGVAKVVIFGARPEQLQVQLAPARMAEAGIGLAEVTKAAGSASAVLGAGVVDTPNQQFVVQPHGQARTAQALANSVVASRDGQPLTLGEVAHVVRAPPPAIGAALVGPHPGLVLVIGSQYGANTLRVTRGLDRALAELAPALRRQGVVVLPDALRPASFVLTALRHLRNSLIIGAILIVAVLFLFLRSWRTAMVSCVAIPLSLLMAAAVLNRFGFSLNTMSLGGLAIALGEVVDDAVVDVENIHRRLRENAALDGPRPRGRVLLEASLEVRGAIIYATFGVVLVFLPVLSLSGVAGRLFAPLALAYIVAILSSLLVALTVTPALAWLLLGRSPPPVADPPAIAAAKRIYRRLLTAADRHVGVVTAAVCLLVAVAFASTVGLSTRFLPDFHERQLILHFRTAPGTALATTVAVGERAARVLAGMPEVKTVVLHAGRAVLSNGHAETNKAEMDLTLTRAGAAAGAAGERRILAAVQGAPGVIWTANTFLVERIHETLSGHTAPVVVTVFGRHLPNLNRDAARLAAALQTVRGAAGVTVAAPPGTPELSVTLDRAALTRYGLTVRQVLGALRTSYAGDAVGRVFTGSRSYPIVVVLPPELRSDPATLAAVPIRTPGGALVRIGALAHVGVTTGQAQILHQGARRVQVVTVNVAGSAAAFLARARPVLAGVRLSAGDYEEIGGSATASGAADAELALRSGLALIAIVALLVIALRDTRLVLLLLANIPFALVGGIAAVWIAGLTVSLGAAVGFVTVFGITLRNGLMLLSHHRRLVLEEGHPWSRETAELGAMHRLAPILMTATVTALGLLPIALGANLPGQEVEGPMAIVILGGLCSSTALTLLVLPSLAARFAGLERPVAGRSMPAMLEETVRSP